MRKSQIEDLTGGVFGSLTILKRTEQPKSRVQWDCLCTCSKIASVLASNLKMGHTTSCGCTKKKSSSIFIGYKTSNLTVTARLNEKGERGVTLWECSCDCGAKTIAQTSELTSSIGRRRKYCRASCPIAVSLKTGSQARDWSGFEQISGQLWSRWRRSAERRKLAFEVSIEYAWELFVTQSARCALTNWEISFGDQDVGRRKREISASLDRIDSTKGYIKNNIQWVHKSANYLKMDLQEKSYLTFVMR